MMLKDKDRTPVAQTVVTLCNRCQMELNHVVMVHNADGYVERVKCNTCGSEHKYRRDKRKPPEKDAFRKVLRPKKRNDPKVFEELFERVKGKEPVPYEMSRSFSRDDVIAHRTFGTGIVTKVSTNRIEVAFPDGPRVLVCERKNVGS